jgi:hypothetical protein
MLSLLIHAVGVYVNLLCTDNERADSLWGTTCPYCGKGVLHCGDYRRTPRGHPPGFERYDGWNTRRSLCCSVCRRRVTPASLRFLGRKVYLAPVVAACAAARREDADALAWLTQTYGLARHTIARWRAWWTRAFPCTRLWKALRGRFRSPVDESRLPAALLALYGRTLDGLRNLLTDLLPITVGSALASEGRAM